MKVRRVRIIIPITVALLTLAAVAASADSGKPSSANGSIVGTWIVDVPETEGGTPGFQSFITFHEGGTLTETNTDLPKGEQGPAAGVWQRRGRTYVATFQVFVFDVASDPAVPVGRVQIRASISLDGKDKIVGDTVIDFIEPDGTVIPDIDRGPFTGTRMQLVAP